MERRPLGGSGLSSGALALGAMNFGCDWHGIGAVDERTAGLLLDLAGDAGVDLVDTADVYGYGASEAMLGRLLKDRPGRFQVATKVCGLMRPGDPSSGGLSARHIAEALDASLRRLGLDSVDLYLAHAEDPRAPLEESLEAFERAVRQGKARAVACSNFPPASWRRALGWAGSTRPRLEVNQVQLSLAAPWAERELGGLCAEAGTSLMAWSPLGGGLLSGKYMRGPRPGGRRFEAGAAFPPLPEARLSGVLRLLEQVARLEGLTMAQAAVGWLLGKPCVAAVTLGARTPAQLKELLGARPLSAKGQALLDRAAALA